MSGLWYDNSYYYCQANAAYSAWSLVVVYEEDSLVNSRINFCYGYFDFTFPSGTYKSDVQCIKKVGSCDTKAKTTVVTFESDDYKGN